MHRVSAFKILFLILFAILVVAFIPFGSPKPILYVVRQTGIVAQEKVPGEKWLQWLYYNPVGQLSLEALAKRKFLSEWYGSKMDSPKSAQRITEFISEFQIDMSIARETQFASFNEFFYRKIKAESRPINADSLLVVSPADGKVLVFSDLAEQDFFIKGNKFRLNDFLKNDSLTKIFNQGSLAIIRLCPTDYHRYHFPVDGEIVHEQKIDGDYYSVSPLALRKNLEIWGQNKREYTVIQSPVFGDIIMCEVGATMVGSMISTYEKNIVAKGEEKGFFKFGGSTVVLIFQKNAVQFDDDLIQNTLKGLETEIKLGERIATKM